jgi:hypothetical protein
MKQVSSNLELIWIFKNSSQNNKMFALSLTGIDMLACRVLGFLLSNSSCAKNKSWTNYVGEEHTKNWNQLDLVLPINFWVLWITVNTLALSN